MVTIKAAGILIVMTRVALATHLRDIKLQPDIQSSHGAVQLYYNSTWVYLCHLGDPHIWNKRSAVVACRQLGFEGGWPLDIRNLTWIETADLQHAEEHLYNFDCDGSESTLVDCSKHEPIRECKDQRLAGVRCYDSFEVKLVGGVAPNAGRVEVRYDDVWSNVCYEPIRGASTTASWNFRNAQIVCRELGFPGTMFAKQGGQGSGTRGSFVEAYRCLQESELMETSLKDCFPNPPSMRSNQDSDPICAFGSNWGGNEAVTVCAVPGYMGCFKTHGFIKCHQSENMTIRMCREHCRESNYTYAFLYRGGCCFCKKTIDETKRIGDAECNEACFGNRFEVCGAIDNSSVYNVNEGLCDGPLNGTGTYYFGDIYKCGEGMKPVGPESTQCIKGDSANETKWSGNFPKCTAIASANKGNQIEGNENSEDSEKKIGFICLVIVLTGILITSIALLVFFARKKYTNSLQPTSFNTSNRTQQPHQYVCLEKGNYSKHNASTSEIHHAYSEIEDGKLEATPMNKLEVGTANDHKNYEDVESAEVQCTGKTIVYEEGLVDKTKKDNGGMIENPIYDISGEVSQ